MILPFIVGAQAVSGGVNVAGTLARAADSGELVPEGGLVDRSLETVVEVSDSVEQVARTVTTVTIVGALAVGGFLLYRLVR